VGVGTDLEPEVSSCHHLSDQAHCLEGLKGLAHGRLDLQAGYVEKSGGES
jgi:hypothetical protein